MVRISMTSKGHLHCERYSKVAGWLFDINAVLGGGVDKNRPVA